MPVAVYGYVLLLHVEAGAACVKVVCEGYYFVWGCEVAAAKVFRCKGGVVAAVSIPQVASQGCLGEGYVVAALCKAVAVGVVYSIGGGVGVDVALR